MEVGGEVMMWQLKKDLEKFRYEGRTYVSILTKGNTLGQGLDGPEIWSWRLRFICGNSAGPILGLYINPKSHNKLWSESSDHGGFPIAFRQSRSHASVFLVV